jgi:uncharacterized protein (DUF58 family)
MSHSVRMVLSLTAKGMRKTRPTSMGWIVLSAIPVFSFAGLIRSDVAMVIVGQLFMVIGAVAYGLAWFHGRQLVCQAWMPPHVTAGKEFSFRLGITNHARFGDLWNWRVLVSGRGGWSAGGSIEWVPPRSVTAIDFYAVIQSRGVIQQLDVDLESDMPFGLMRTRHRLAVHVVLVVRPKPEWPGHWNHMRASGSRASEADLAGGRFGYGDVKGLRSWKKGDSPRSIVWPMTLRSLAGGGPWLVREHDASARRFMGYTVIFHSCGGAGALIRPGRFEEALSQLVGLIVSLSTQGLRVRMVADFHEWIPWDCRSGRSLGLLWNELASARRCSSTEAHELTAVVRQVDPQDGVILLSDFPLSVWKHAVPESLTGVWIPECSERRRRRRVVTR